MVYTDRAFTDVLLALRILSHVLPFLDSLLNCRCFLIVPTLLLIIIDVQIWVLSAGIFCVLLPVWESRAQMAAIIAGCFTIFGSKESKTERGIKVVPEKV
jgi:hypothetical protein